MIQQQFCMQPVDKTGTSSAAVAELSTVEPRDNDKLDLGSPTERVRTRIQDLCRDFTRQGRLLPPPSKFAFYGSLALLLAIPCLVVVWALTGSHAGSHYRAYVIPLCAVVIVLIVLVYGICDKTQKKRASEAFGAQVDRKRGYRV